MVFVGAFGLAPSEFWRMHPTELWWFIEAKLPADFEPKIEPNWNDLYAMLSESDE